MKARRHPLLNIGGAELYPCGHRHYVLYISSGYLLLPGDFWHKILIFREPKHPYVPLSILSAINSTESRHYEATYLPHLINVVCEQTLICVNPLQFFSQLFGVIKFVKGNAWVLTFCIYSLCLKSLKITRIRQNFFINKKLCVIESWWWDSWSSHKTLPWLISSPLISQPFVFFFPFNFLDSKTDKTSKSKYSFHLKKEITYIGLMGCKYLFRECSFNTLLLLIMSGPSSLSNP